MAVVFASVSRNQTLRLALESFLFAISAYWLRSAGGFWAGLAVVLFFAYAYFRPISRSFKFLIVSFTLLAYCFLFPNLGSLELEALFAFSLGVLMYLLVGVKDMLFIKRKETTQLLYSMIFFMGVYLYFSVTSLASQIGLFFFSLFLFRELYVLLSDGSRKGQMLVSVVSSLIGVELAWGLGLLPLSSSSASIIVTAGVFIVNDIFMAYKLGTIADKTLRWEIATAIVLSFIILAFSRWSLS